MVSTVIYRTPSFGKKKKTIKKKKPAALSAPRIAYVKGKGTRVRKICKKRNKRGKIVWKYADGKTVRKGKKRYSTKAKASGPKPAVRRKKAKRASFGSFGQGRADSLQQIMGPYAASAFGRSVRRPSAPKKATRASFGSYGQGRPNSLQQMMGPYAASAFGRRVRRQSILRR